MVRSAAAVPVRTCIGCRRRAPRTDLIRVVTGPDGAAVPDPRGRMPGRGAWLHLDPDCYDLAQRRKAFARALRVVAPVDTAAVQRHIGESGLSTSGTEVRPTSTDVGPDRKRVEKR